MEIDFIMSEADALALTENFLENSPSHRRTRVQVRWMLPVLLSVMLAIWFVEKGPDIGTAMIFGLASLAWAIFYPRRYDARVRSATLAQMKESSYSKRFGQIHVEITDELLKSSGPTGKSEHTWDSIDRIVLTPDYLFVFFAGMSGLPISVQQLGVDSAQSAYDLLKSKHDAATRT